MWVCSRPVPEMRLGIHTFSRDPATGEVVTGQERMGGTALYELTVGGVTASRLS
ncbi:hypothetical protein HFO42_10090 [Rhizobium leguminosarum]|uniref:Uncharacterized protein n=1 Tax=Rhizobium leguminosarum TaxID=384 RepID=A0AAJ1A7H4_RHILE|nr:MULTISPECIES: hypothetical protein [Rhizobium]MBY3123089.1 hypothetical protein [Rhizobium laguerreae]MBY5538085.1 hypothetical protein [Rhizobium leguminosarum]MBY5550030.1 hypothetical protein [Rhizobium leguminosarum]MBY5565345.1 hypothetical protein [Rhizobium leguminosarum]MBY5599156.1 hypothetical protein [Rhizobium leguminosarum]